MPGVQNATEMPAETPAELCVKVPDLAFSVAITGHRKLAPRQRHKLETLVLQTLNEISTQLTAQVEASPIDKKRQINLRFISALAAGADQLGAQASLKTEAAWSLEVILPYAEDAYRESLRDMPGKPIDSKAYDSYADLKARASRVLQLNDWPPQGLVTENADYWITRRYRTLGQMLVRQADLLIAVWNGEPSAGIGGTADVVSEARRVGLPIIWIESKTLRRLGVSAEVEPTVTNVIELAQRLRPLSDAELEASVAPAIAMAVNAVLLGSGKAKHKGAKRGELGFFLGKGQAMAGEPVRNRTRAVFYQMFIWIYLLGARFKHSGQTKGPPLLSWPGLQLRTDHAAEEDANLTDSPLLRQIEAPIRDLFIVSDTIATRLGHIYRSSYVLIFLAAALAVCTGLLSSFFDAHSKWIFVTLELCIISALIVVHITSQLSCFHRRWLKARYIAESSRVSRVLAWLGFSGRRPTGSLRPDVGSEHGQERGQEPDWAPALLNAVMALPGVTGGVIDRSALSAVSKALRGIVTGQIAYHEKNSERLEELHMRLDRVSWIMVVLAAVIGLAFLVAFNSIGHLKSPPGWYLNLKTLTAFAGGAGPAIAAAMASIRYHGDFERFAQRSHQTATQLKQMRARLERLESELGSNALHAPPFESLLDIALATQDVFEADLEDWRFVYAARPTPGL